MAEMPYFALEEVYQLFGYTNLSSCHNAIRGRRFPIQTYKIGRTIVVDREVVRAYFRKRRDEGLAQLEATCMLVGA